jgi:uncharacterized cupredoxin-like copper-binding protein
MILKSPTSRLSLVNLFSDFILNQIPKEEESIIQVIDCLNFYVIKGKTTYNEPLNIGKLKDEFIVKFEDLIGDIKITHTIDLIEYNSNLKPSNSLTFSYHNTNNCSYNNQQIKSFEEDKTISYDYHYHLKQISEDNNLIFCSEFPHGYSLNQGRLFYYYGKHIFYNIPSSYPVSTLTFEMSTKKDESGDQVFLVKNNLSEIDSVLTSAILDVFDFNMSWLEQEIKKVDWSVEITNPLEDYSFLTKKIKEFILF